MKLSLNNNKINASPPKSLGSSLSSSSENSKLNKSDELRSMVLRSFLKSREVSPLSSPSPSNSRSGSFTARLKKSQTNVNESIDKIMNLFSEGKEFRSRGDSINHVFPLDLNNETMGYLKIGKEGEEGVVAMETFMYYVSIYFDISDYFTETNIMKITPRKLKRLSIPSKNENGESKQNSLDAVFQNKPTNGSYQTALKGRTLKAYLKDNVSLSFIIQDPIIRMIQFALAFFYTIVLGMFDVNPGNIIFEENQIKFFDNTRCLAHSTEFIIWGSTFQIAFRSSLLELNESYQDLPKDLLVVLEKEISKFKKKMKNFDSFIQKKEIKKLLDQLPPGWFYHDLVILTINEKLERIYNRLKCNKIKTCEDLIHAAFPHYRFFAMLFVINEYLSNKAVINKAISIKKDNKNLDDLDYNEFWKQGLHHAQTIDFIESIQNCYFLGINVKELLNECLKDNFSYTTIMKSIYEKIKFTVDLDYIDTLLGEIDDMRKKNKLKDKIDDLIKINENFNLILLSLENILIEINNETIIKEFMKHKNTLELIKDDINDINVKIRQFLNGEKLIKDILYGLHYTIELRNFIAEIGNDILSNIVSEKDEEDIYTIIDYFYDQAKPDFKDIPNDRIRELIDDLLENEFRNNSIVHTRELSYNFSEYIIEIIEPSKYEKQKKYYLKYKKMKWKFEKIRVIQLDVYSSPGFVILLGKQKIKPMTIYQFIKWLPTFSSHKI